MADIRSIFIDVRVGTTGTDDYVLLGVVGTRGGREFSLDSSEDDFQPRSEAFFEIGAPSPFGNNDPFGIVKRVPINGSADAFAHNQIDLKNVTSVYLRKHGHSTADDDDAVEILEARVLLTDGELTTHSFAMRGRVMLGIDHGLQVWLEEVTPISSPIG